MKNVFTVARFTFTEVYRSKVMTSIIFLAIFLIFVTYVASEFAYGAPAKVALDFGLGIITFSNLGMAIFIGATLLSKEIEQKTLYMILSRAMSRTSFLIGKIIGLSSVLIINTGVLSLMSLLIYLYLKGTFQELYLWAVYFTFVEAFIMLLFAVLFSLLTNTTMSVIYCLITFIVGHALNETSKLFFAKISPLTMKVIAVSSYFIPNFYKLNLKDFVIYKKNMELDYLLGMQLYAVTYTLALLILVSYIFKNKNLD